MSRPRLLALAGAALVAVISAAPSAADPITPPGPLASGAVPPPSYTGYSIDAYQGLFGGQGGWAPQGTVVADSGFRPYPNGFSFTNYGTDMRTNQVLFGQPTPLPAGSPPTPAVAMDSITMRQTFGNGVCLPGQDLAARPGCTLTESAETVRGLVAGWGAAGHCYGLATIAAAFFDGLVPPGSLRTGSVNSLTTLNDSTQRTILRALVAQYFSATGTRPGSMADAISTLRAALTPGRAPITLLIYGTPGGHALTPFAVLDRGSGQFDIAVYDSNIPNQMRAVHVNTTANTWQYEGAINPVSGPLLWDSTQPKTSMLLGSVADSVRVQGCVFCTYRSDTSVVSFSPVLSQNAGVYDDIRLLAPDGSVLDPSKYVIVPPTNPIVGGLVQGPVLRVDVGVPYSIAISGAAVHDLQPFAVTVVGKRSTQSVTMGALTPASSGTFAIGGLTRAVAFVGQEFQKVAVAQTTEQGTSSYRFSGVQETGSGSGGLYMRVISDKARVVFKDIHGLAATWSLRMTSARLSSRSVYTAGRVTAPAGSTIVVLYPGWKGGTGRPHAWLDLGTDGRLDREIPLVRGRA